MLCQHDRYLRRVVEKLVQSTAERHVRQIKVRDLYGQTAVLRPQRVAQLITENGYGQHWHAVVDGLNGAVHSPVSYEQFAVRMTYIKRTYCDVKAKSEISMFIFE